MNEPATKQDLQEAIGQLKVWMLERESASIRWFVGTQIAYFIVTWSSALGLVYFMTG
jgi:hypothetical protein